MYCSRECPRPPSTQQARRAGFRGGAGASAMWGRNHHPPPRTQPRTFLLVPFPPCHPQPYLLGRTRSSWLEVLLSPQADTNSEPGQGQGSPTHRPVWAFGSVQSRKHCEALLCTNTGMSRPIPWGLRGFPQCRGAGRGAWVCRLRAKTHSESLSHSFSHLFIQRVLSARYFSSVKDTSSNEL